VLPVLIGALAPKDMNIAIRTIICFCGFATIFALLFSYLRAKVWKKS